MAQYHINEPEDCIECPYDSTHMVRVKRFPYHLMKCRKNNPTMDMAHCPFNARHEVPRVELRYHISRCPDRAVLNADLVYEQVKQGEEGSYFHGNCSVPAYDNGTELPATEDWSTDCDNTEWVMNRWEEPNMIVSQKFVTSRPPQTTPLVLQQMKVLPPDDSALNMSGLGRGQSRWAGDEKANNGMSIPNGVTRSRVAQGLQENTSLLEALARGRGIGRGIQAVGDGVPGRMRGPPANGNSGWTPGGCGTTSQQLHTSLLAAREHLTGPRKVNAPPMSLNGGSLYRASPEVAHSPKRVHSSRGMQSTFSPRGKGRGVAGFYGNGGGYRISPSFVVPNTNQPNEGLIEADFHSDNVGGEDNTEALTEDNTEALTEDNTEALTEDNTEEQMAHKREVRKLQKKLRKIKQLEEKEDDGQALDKDQLEKISRKSSIKQQLAKLGVQG